MTQTDIEVPATSGEGALYPEDVYVAEFTEFVGPEDLPEEAQTYGPAVKLVYKFVEGEYAGETIDELASLKGGPRAKLRQRAETLRGEPYGANEGIRLVPLIGKRIKLVIKTAESGYSKIDSTIAMPAPRTAAPPPRAAQPTAAPAPAGKRRF